MKRPTLAIFFCCAGLCCLSACSSRGSSFGDMLFGSPLPSADARNSTAERGFTAQSLRPENLSAEELKTWQRSQLVPNSARLKVGDDDALPLKAMRADVRIDGHRARVLLSYLYENTHDRQLEGTFQLRLPNGASPYLLAFGNAYLELDDEGLQHALDLTPSYSSDPDSVIAQLPSTWNQVKAARMTPRETAAFAYGSTVRRKVDPALAEWAGAGVFNCRVFPLLPRQQQRIMIGYDVDLLAVGEDWEYRFDVPQGVPHCRVELDVSRLVWGADRGAAEMQIDPQPVQGVVDDARARFVFEDPGARALQLRLKQPGSLALVSPLDEDGGGHFLVQLTPDLPREEASDGRAQAIFLLDTSLSAHPDKLNIWRDLLLGILSHNEAQLERFAVLFFNVEAHLWQPGFVANTPEQRDALARAIDALALEAATDLGNALGSAADCEGFADADLFLLSDGAANWGETDGRTLAATLPADWQGSLFAYATGLAGGSLATLEQLGQAHRGAVFSVVGEAQLAEAARAHRLKPWRIESLSIVGGEQLLVQGQPRNLFPGQRLKLVGQGRLLGSQPIRLRVRQGSRSLELELPIERIVPSPLARRAFGQLAVEQLESYRGADAQLKTAYARHFQVPGRSCSLVMLESEADYQAFGITNQADLAVIEAEPAAAAVEQCEQALGEAAQNPRERFLRWFDELPERAMVDVRLPEALPLLLRNLPASSFELDSEALQCQLRGWDDLPGSFHELLAAPELDYLAFQQEAQRRLQAAGPADALKAVSSLIERQPGDGQLSRDLAFQALQWGLPGHAWFLLLRVAEQRPWEPQTYLAMGECLAELERPDMAIACYELALGGSWDGRFGEFQQVAWYGYLPLLQRVVRGDLPSGLRSFARHRLNELGGRYGTSRADLVVAIQWNTEGNDIDLHVIEPSGEECFYSHPITDTGRLSQDVTQGYGPEIYVCEQADSGVYQVRLHYYAGDTNRTGLRTRVFATVYRNWGTPAVEVERLAINLEENKQMVDVVELKF